MMRALALVPENIENFLPPLVIASARGLCKQNNRDDRSRQSRQKRCMHLLFDHCSLEAYKNEIMGNTRWLEPLQVLM